MMFLLKFKYEGDVDQQCWFNSTCEEFSKYQYVVIKTDVPIPLLLVRKISVIIILLLFVIFHFSDSFTQIDMCTCLLYMGFSKSITVLSAAAIYKEKMYWCIKLEKFRIKPGVDSAWKISICIYFFSFNNHFADSETWNYCTVI